MKKDMDTDLDRLIATYQEITDTLNETVKIQQETIQILQEQNDSLQEAEDKLVNEYLLEYDEQFSSAVYNVLPI